MGKPLFKLGADYGTSKTELFSTDLGALRTFGQDHHLAARIKPCLTLENPQGQTVATMDEWATEWLPCDA